METDGWVLGALDGRSDGMLEGSLDCSFEGDDDGEEVLYRGIDI